VTEHRPPHPRPLSSREAEAYRLQSLPETAGQVDPGELGRPAPPDGGPPSAAWLVGVLALVTCVVVGLVYFLASGGDGDGQVSTLAGDSATSGGTTGPTGIAVASTTTSATSATSEQPADDATLPAPSGTGLTGTMIGDQIVVAGAVPTTQASAGLVLLLEQVAGVGNVDTAGLAVDPGVAMPDRIALVVGSEVVFAISSDVIEPEFLPVLDNVAEMLIANPDLTAVVEGHADSVGNPSQNLSLSQRRADVVVDHLAGKGIERVRLVAIGRGSDEPIADNATAEGREQNRRIEFVIVGFRLNL
jgi:outer membrane protein OmpA-like peptidoglycan-associated protein